MASRIGPIAACLTLTLTVCACVSPIQPVQDEVSALAPPTPSCLLITQDFTTVHAPCGDPAIPYTAAEVIAACNHVYPLDPFQAFANPRSAGDIAVWTFGVNFDLLNSQGAPIGCLTLLRRDPASRSYVPIDRGGILVDTCRSSTSLPPVEDGIATFDGTNDVTCAMNLGVWLRDVNLQAYVRDSLGVLGAPELAQRLDAAIPDDLMTVYETYALVASLTQEQPPPCAANSECRLPIFSLLPIPEEADPSFGQRLAIVARPGGRSFSFFSDDSACLLPATWEVSAEPAMIWRNVLPVLPNPPTDMEYLYRRAADEVEVACYEPGYSGFVPFWLGNAELVIGRDAETGATFFGELDGILIGPPDSKPPS